MALAAGLRAAGGELVTGRWLESPAKLPAARAAVLDLTPRQVLAIAARLSPGIRRRASVPLWSGALMDRAMTVGRGTDWCADAPPILGRWLVLGADAPYVGDPALTHAVGAPTVRLRTGPRGQLGYPDLGRAGREVPTAHRPPGHR